MKDYIFLGVCDKVRASSPKNEQLWHEMMENKSPITDLVFLESVDFAPVLDEDEDARDWITENRLQDKSAGAYVSIWDERSALFFQTCGFEYIYIFIRKDPTPVQTLIQSYNNTEDLYKLIEYEGWEIESANEEIHGLKAIRVNKHTLLAVKRTPLVPGKSLPCKIELLSIASPKEIEQIHVK